MQHEHAYYRLTVAGILALSTLTLSACKKPVSHLERVKQAGELVVVTRDASTSYFQGPDGPAGLEHDLALGFAEHLGVQLRLVVAERTADILPMVASGEADLAAGVTVRRQLGSRVRFTPDYQKITQQLIYRRGERDPASIDDIYEGYLEVVSGSAHAETLESLRKQYPELRWVETPAARTEELLNRVWEKRVDFAIADSHELAYVRRFYPELRVAFDLSEPKRIAWALPLSTDDTLYRAATKFIRGAKEDGTLAQLKERYFGHVNDFDYVQTKVFLRHIEKRLPRYEPHFLTASSRYEVDWRLLAAMGYQESAWNPRAISPTGVRGIMMLTLATASHVGIKNRLDPEQSILGGARYFSRILSQLPERITNPDRTWLALAAYNVGFGHLEDARALTQHLGMDPDRWVDVKKQLPLLRKKEFYAYLKHGYARGDEAVTYVERIRDYYEQLMRRFPLTDETRQKFAEDLVASNTPSS